MSITDTLKETFPEAFNKKTGAMSRIELVDSMYKLRIAAKILTAREKLISESLKASMQADLDRLDSEHPELEVAGGSTPGFKATRIWQKRLDTDRIKAEMGDDWVETHQKEVDFIQFKSLKEAE